MYVMSATATGILFPRNHHVFLQSSRAPADRLALATENEDMLLPTEAVRAKEASDIRRSSSVSSTTAAITRVSSPKSWIRRQQPLQ